MASLGRRLYPFLFFLVSFVAGLTPAQWRAQSIYQVMTDRFARTDGSTTAACDLNEYCGGTWQGLISRLDYIQQMGFTAVLAFLNCLATGTNNSSKGMDITSRQESDCVNNRRQLIPWILGFGCLCSQFQLRHRVRSESVVFCTPQQRHGMSQHSLSIHLIILISHSTLW